MDGKLGFVIIQSIVFLIWMALNVVMWAFHWDPCPFILLNLLLSFEGAFFGPIIMISQNRQS